MNIGKAAKLADLTVKTVRYYADIEVVRPKKDYHTGYRKFSSDDVAKLQFIGKARKFGFSVEECRELLALYEDTNRPSREVKNLTLEKVAEIDKKLDELNGLRNQLANLALACHGDDRPECPILDTFSATTS
ncbi:MAG: heavy metal-responsive transcriptional regulator [Rhodospirillaceae bacterium]|mgnify:CR=1 FL=1|nr:heavy metal-responsive transcriptional regulator [Rhodospirillaceae bacterium]|tara:strand:+ start:250 stop:645 length:396 start_codon:yes stop_codon:yes gene_type:complete